MAPSSCAWHPTDIRLRCLQFWHALAWSLQALVGVGIMFIVRSAVGQWARPGSMGPGNYWVLAGYLALYVWNFAADTFTYAVSVRSLGPTFPEI